MAVGRIAIRADDGTVVRPEHRLDSVPSPAQMRMANTETPSVTAVHNQAWPRRSRQPVSSRLTVAC